MKLKLLVEAKTVEDIYHSDSAEDLDALIKADKNGEYIYKAGKFWENFDYKKGLDALINKDKPGGYIYYAGIYWKSFDYGKGIKALENTSYYKKALKDWPRGIQMSQAISKDIKAKAKKLPKRKLKL